MSTSSPQPFYPIRLADPSRQLPEPRWWTANKVLGNMASWCSQMGLEDFEVERFLPCVRRVLVDRGLLMEDMTKKKRENEDLIDDLISKHPDVCCPGRIPREILAKVIGRITTHINTRERRSRGLRLRTRRPGKREQNGSLQSNAVNAEERKNEASESSPPSLTSPLCTSPAHTAMSANSPIASLPSTVIGGKSSFQPRLIIVHVTHHSEPNWVYAVFLAELLSPTRSEKDLDIPLLHGILLDPLLARLAGFEVRPSFEFFDPAAEYLTYEYLGMRWEVEDQAAFQRACQHLVLEAISFDSSKAPILRFQTELRFRNSSLSPEPMDTMPIERYAE